MCDAVKDWRKHARHKKKKEKRLSTKNTPKYMAIQEVAYNYYLIHVILEFDNTKLYSTFHLPRNFFKKLTWKEKIRNCSSAILIVFFFNVNSGNFTKHRRLESLTATSLGNQKLI